MGLKGKRKNVKTGGYSRTFVIPAGLEIGDVSTYAADRLIILDPRGDISEDELLEFLEAHIEPNFWPWIAKKKKEKELAAANE